MVIGDWNFILFWYDLRLQIAGKNNFAGVTAEKNFDQIQKTNPKCWYEINDVNDDIDSDLFLKGVRMSEFAKEKK